MVGQGLREVVGGSSFVGFLAGPRLQARRRDRKVPGCLTGESEERETWTAESLRAASSNGESFGFFRKRAAMEETSAVLRFKVHRAELLCPRVQSIGVVDLVNVTARERRHAQT
jgi:hypothetical protein